MTRSSSSAVAAGLALLLAACSDGGVDTAGPGTTTTATATTRTPASSPSTTATTATTTGASTTTTAGEREGISYLELLAPDLVVTIDELGATGFDDAGFTPPSGPNVCGVDIDADVPADVVVGATFTASDGSGVVEEVLRVYSEAGTGPAYDALVASFGCGTGVDGITTVTGPTDESDVIAAVGGAVSFELTAGDATTTVVMARQADAVVTVTYSGPPRPDVDPVTVAAFAVGKILAALGE